MSDIFNQSNVKTSVKEYFDRLGSASAGRDNLQRIVAELIDPVPPAEDKTNYAALYELLKERRVPVFRPREILAIHPVQLDEVASEHLVSVFPGVDEVQLPVGPEGFIPKYDPKHRTYERPAKTINALTYQTAELIRLYPEHKDHYLESLIEIVGIYNRTVYSSGTLSGQIERLVAGIDVARGRNGHHKNKSLKELGLSIQDVVAMLRQTLPLDDAEPNLPLTHTIGEYLFNEGEQKLFGVSQWIPPLSMSSTAGLPYIGRTKGQCAVEAIICADTLLKQQR